MERWVMAAHPDDELLGLGGMIQDQLINKVVYPDTPLNDLRAHEGEELGKKFGFGVSVGTLKLVEAPRETLVYVPSPTDVHPDHQALLSDVATILVTRPDLVVREYKVGGGAPYTETVTDALYDWKRSVFRRFYKSQAGVLTDPSFFLFEGNAPLGVPDLTVTFSRVGFHCWPDAPDEVAYLRLKHRHVFRVSFTLIGLHSVDRQEEFHMVQQWASERFEVPSKNASCETMARALALRGRARYARPCEVEVWEDGEVGAKVRV